MEIWHLKDAAQIVLLVLTFGQRIYSGPVISLVKHPSRPFSLPSVWTERRSPLQQKESKSREIKKKRPIFGLQTKHVAGGDLGDLAGAASLQRGFGDTLHGALQPWLLFLWRWTLARPPRRSDLRAPVTHLCHGSAHDKAFPVGRGGDVNPFAGWGLRRVPGGLLRLRGDRALWGAGEDTTAQSSSSWDWDYWERKYSLGQQAHLLWIWKLDHCSRAGVGLEGRHSHPHIVHPLCKSI